MLSDHLTLPTSCSASCPHRLEHCRTRNPKACMVVLLRTRVRCYLHLDQVTLACTGRWTHRHFYPGCPLILPIYLSTPALNFIAMSTHDQPRWPTHAQLASASERPFSRDIVDFPLFFSRVALIASYSTIRAANRNCSIKRKFTRSARELEGTRRWSQSWLRIQGPWSRSFRASRHRKVIDHA